ncbi:MAG: type VII toxin-antitoxin system MntA family adenylyltransferase antitoxin, partial [Thermoflexus sp.]
MKSRGGIGYLSEEQLERLVRRLGECPNVLAVFLFGSQVNGYACPESDVDLGVLFERDPSLEEELDVGVAAEEALGMKRVDIVNLNRAHLLLRHRAISGLLIYERDPIRVSDFMEETIIRYMHRICSRQHVFEVALNNYSGYPPHSIYLRVQDHHPFRQLVSQ